VRSKRDAEARLTETEFHTSVVPQGATNASDTAAAVPTIASNYFTQPSSLSQQTTSSLVTRSNSDQMHGRRPTAAGSDPKRGHKVRGLGSNFMMCSLTSYCDHRWRSWQSGYYEFGQVNEVSFLYLNLY
jgi:hypothetical protein